MAQCGFSRAFFLLGILVVITACTTEDSPSEPTAAGLQVIEETEAAETASPTPAGTLTTVPLRTSTPPANTAAASASNCSPRADWVMTLTVHQGDTLASLADWSSTTVDILARGNCLSTTDQLRVGQVIRVPVVPSPTPIGYIPPTPLPTDSAPVQIILFTSSATEATAGDSVTLQWQVQGATGGIYLRREYRDSTTTTAQAPQVLENLDATGSQTVSFGGFAQERYFLVATTLTQSVEKEITITNKAVDLRIPPEIVSFTGQVVGGQILLAWQVTGTDLASVSIRPVLSSGTFGEWQNNQPLSGSLTLDIPEGASGTITVMLIPITKAGEENLPFEVIQSGKHQINLTLP
jgi:LysM repeat protein